MVLLRAPGVRPTPWCRAAALMLKQMGQGGGENWAYCPGRQDLTASACRRSDFNLCRLAREVPRETLTICAEVAGYVDPKLARVVEQLVKRITQEESHS
jgi:hypothetical protein